MDIKKGRLLLNKINRLFDGFEDDNGKASSIETGLMRSYLRDFYETFLETDNTPPLPKTQPQYEAPKPVYEPPKPKLTPEEREPVRPEFKPKPIDFEIEKPKYEPPVAKYEPPKPEPKPEPKYETPKPESKPEPKYEAPEPKPEPPKEPVIPVQPIQPVEPPPSQEPMSYDEYDVLFEEQAVKDISDRLNQSKITNLRASMGINERFLMQNELFGGNNKNFNEAIDSLNSFTNFAQAKAYIIKVLAPDNDWLDEKRLRRAKAFISKTKRLYK